MTIIDWPPADPTSPFFCHGPTLVSFSGGRTSAYMLWCILCAHGGVLPSYVYIVFANTGKEREETLRFVHECSVRWNVKIWWVEWRPPGARMKAAKCPHRRRGRCDDCKRAALITAAEKRFETVGLNSADRTGVWFAELIRRKQYLPNQDMRYCTTTLKVETMKWFMVAQGHTHWFNMVGLRADEKSRVLKQVARNSEARERWISGCPLFIAGVTERIVWNFWLGRNVDPRNLAHPLPQGFDLGLRKHEGNCDLCFLKGRGKKAEILRECPSIGAWWAEQERVAKVDRRLTSDESALFDKRESVLALLRAIESQAEIAFDEGADTEMDCTGDTCEVDEGVQDSDIDDSAVKWMVAYMARLAADPEAAMPTRVKAAEPAMRDLFAALEDA